MWARFSVLIGGWRDIGVGVPRQRAEPGFDRIHAFGHAGEVAALDHLLDQPGLLGRDAGVLVPNRDGGGDVGLADIVGAQFLQRHVRIDFALLAASESTRVEASLVITSLKIAAMLLRLANHCRLILVSSFTASVLSSKTARVDQRYGKASRFSSSRMPGCVRRSGIRPRQHAQMRAP